MDFKVNNKHLNMLYWIQPVSSSDSVLLNLLVCMHTWIGREKEAILISLVRSNDAHEVGFLREDRRLNVAITRARRHVCIVLDSDTVSAHPFLSRLIDYASEYGDYRMATDPNEVRQDLSGSGIASSTSAAPVAVAGTEKRKEEGSTNQSPVVSQPKVKVKRERIRPALPSSASSPSVVGASGVVQPVIEEWSEARLLSLCEEVLKAGRRHSFPPVIDDSRTQFAFPPTLNSFERHLVHEVAERIGGNELAHDSTGEGMQRFILLRYIWPKPTKTADVTADEIIDGSAEEEKSSNAPVGSGISNKQRKKEAKKQAQLQASQQQQQHAEDKAAARQKAIDAMELKSTGKITSSAPKPIVSSAAAVPIPAAPSSGFDALAGEEEETDTIVVDDSSTTASSAAAMVPSKQNKKKKKKSSPSDSTASVVAGNDDEDDLDALLSEFNPEVCSFHGCTSRVKVMGFTCAYCKGTHCLKHMNPVLHGCATAHKDKQISDMHNVHKAQLKGGSTQPMKETQKALLQSKLDKKIAADKSARTKQTKKEDKKK
jgi:hypothetical protein